MSWKPQPESNEKGVGISFKLSTDTDDILTMSARRSERAKKREAKLRLEDHLRRFPDWSL